MSERKREREGERQGERETLTCGGHRDHSGESRTGSLETASTHLPFSRRGFLQQISCFAYPSTAGPFTPRRAESKKGAVSHERGTSVHVRP